MKFNFIKMDTKTIREVWVAGLVVSIVIGAALQVWFADNLMLDVSNTILLLNIATGALKGVGIYVGISGLIFAGALLFDALKSKDYCDSFKTVGVLIAIISNFSYWLTSAMLTPANKGGMIEYGKKMAAITEAVPLGIALLVSSAIILQLAINYFWNVKRRNNQ
jgi:hypothetical protein